VGVAGALDPQKIFRTATTLAAVLLLFSALAWLFEKTKLARCK
jgi:flagellar biogenesis protein FliO